MILSQTKNIYSSAVSTSVFKLTYTRMHFKVKNGRKFFETLRKIFKTFKQTGLVSKPLSKSNCDCEKLCFVAIAIHLTTLH